jgi:hypothetical protein
MINTVARCSVSQEQPIIGDSTAGRKAGCLGMGALKLG